MNKKNTTQNEYKIALLPGDGIGPAIVNATAKIINKIATQLEFKVIFKSAPIGGAAIDSRGCPLPDETVDLCKSCDAVLMGAVGGPKWDNLTGNMRPEKGILGIRRELGLFANLRPAIVYNALKAASPLKDSILGDGIDIMVVRELTGGIYFGKRRSVYRDEECIAAYDTEEYTAYEIERIARVAFNVARKRKKMVCSVDKANVLDSSMLWRTTVQRISKEFDDVELSHMYVDNAAMQLIRNPRQFDVVLTNNMFGDILSDEASQITGSIGMLPSASIGSSSLGLYEPIHGSAPDIAHLNIANPIATILSASMMFRYSLSEIEAADRIEKAVIKFLNLGYRTKDIASGSEVALNTDEATNYILDLI
ncbi:MAG: 3-isopropylmalate dehydrogenase [Christensenellaceae bacterium]|jgi:3-isopropylmalate dehydrogenase|nr:3-isopropylmalate dehydrogenase [Christensenellaceae bacterium]